jgi:hypothetical protein
MVAQSSVESSLTITLTVPFCGVGVGVGVAVGALALLELPQPTDKTIIEARASPGRNREIRHFVAFSLRGVVASRFCFPACAEWNAAGHPG